MKETVRLRLLERCHRELGESLLAAAAEAHGVPARSWEWFQWKYLNSPYGKAAFAFAMDGSGIAGAVAFGCYRLMRDGESIAGALSYETFVLPKYRKQGLFLRLAKMALSEVRERGARVALNFPNSRSLSGFLKLGWERVDGVEYWIRPCGVGWVARGLSLRQPFRCELIHKFDPADYEGFEGLLEYVKPCVGVGRVGAYASEEYLCWRYRTLPGNRYVAVENPLGAALARVGWRGKLREAQIMELAPVDGYSRKFAKAVVASLRSRVDVDLISVCLSRAHPMRRYLRPAFVRVPNRVNCSVYVFDEDLSVCKNPGVWVLSARDFHTY